MSAAPFSGRVAYVTGASSGIGAATAELLAARGAAVACVARDEARGRATVDRIHTAGGTAVYIAANVERRDDIARSVAETIGLLGRLDMAFNNAGISGNVGMIHEQEEAEWDRVIATNLNAVFLCMKHQITHMMANGGGAIVNNSSGAGVIAADGLPHYTAAKHGVLGLTKSAAKDYARYGIRVNAVCPGLISTPQLERFMEDDEVRAAMLSRIPTGALGRPRDIAGAVAFLFSDDAAYISGDTMFVDAGIMCR